MHVYAGPVSGMLTSAMAAATIEGESDFAEGFRTCPPGEWQEPYDTDLGHRMDYLGDVNGDGIGDLVIVGGGHREESGVLFPPGDVDHLCPYTEPRASGAFVFHGPLSGTRPVSSADARFVGMIADSSFAGDLDGDGVNDLAVTSCPWYGNASDVHLFVLGGDVVQLDVQDYANASAAAIATVQFPEGSASLGCDNTGEPYGRLNRGVGDMNGDGYDDLVAGSHRNGYLGLPAEVGVLLGPVVGVVSVADAAAIVTFGYNEGYPSTASAGDADGDGRADLAVSAGWGPNVFVLSAPSGHMDLMLDATLGKFEPGDPIQSLSFGIAPLGDQDGDGIDDLAIASFTATSIVFGEP